MSFLRGPARVPCWPRRRSAETPSGKLPQTISSNNVKNTLFLPYCWRQVLGLGVQGLSARLAPALHDFAAGRISNSSAPKGSKTRCFEPILKMSFLRGPSRGPCWPRRRSSETPSGELPQKNGHNNYQKHVVFTIVLERGFGSWLPRIFPLGWRPRPPRFRSGLDFKILLYKKDKIWWF